MASASTMILSWNSVKSQDWLFLILLPRFVALKITPAMPFWKYWSLQMWVPFLRGFRIAIQLSLQEGKPQNS